jgi:AraC-like DNA-binding protein
MKAVFLPLFFIFQLLIPSLVFGQKSDFPLVLSSLQNAKGQLESLSPRSIEIHYGFQKEKISFPLNVKNDRNDSNIAYLIFLWSHLDEVEVCLSNGNCSKAGYSHPVSSWPIAQIFPVFPIQLEPGQEITIQVTIRSRNFISSEIQLLTTEELFYLISWQTGLVFGFLVLISAFVVRLIYLTLIYPKEWMFFNLLFHACITLIFVIGTGLGSCYLFPNWGLSLSLFKKVIIGILILSGTEWLSRFLQTKEKFRIFHQTLNLFKGVTLLLIALSFTDFPRYYISISYTVIYFLLTFIFIGIAISKSKDQLKPSPWLLLSLLCLLFFEILNIFSYRSFDTHDSKIYMIFLAAFLPANAFFVSKTIKDQIKEVLAEDTLSKNDISRLKNDLNQHLIQSTTVVKKSYLTGVDTDKVLSKLKSLMSDEKLFLEEELRLADLAAHLSLSVHQTSELINQVLNTSFSDLLKFYRIEEAKRMLLEDQNKNILDIALECGFQSKSVFNDSFKKYALQTPAEYRKAFKTKTLV